MNRGPDGGLTALTHRRTYFDELYRNDHDPWRFEVSWYERRKRDTVRDPDFELVVWERRSG